MKNQSSKSSSKGIPPKGFFLSDAQVHKNMANAKGAKPLPKPPLMSYETKPSTERKQLAKTQKINKDREYSKLTKGWF